MVQLNPFKWGSKKRKENLKIADLKRKASTTTMGRSYSKNRKKAQDELNKMGHKTDAQKAKEDKAARAKYTKDNRIVNRRGRTTGYKEGYDPSKGVQKNKPNNKTTTTSKSKDEKKKKRRSRFADTTQWD